MDAKSARADGRIAEIASRQHGVISVGQLRMAGATRSAVQRRVQAGRLHRLHQGVYAVGYAPRNPEGRWMAAVLAYGAAGGRGDACGAGDSTAIGATTVLGHWGAVLSHRSAAELWALLPVKAGAIDISVPGGGGRRRRKGIRLHRSLSLASADVTLRRGIPTTNPLRTISDLQRVARPGRQGLVTARELRRAIRQADVLGLSIGSGGDGDRTRSDLERAFLRLCRRHHLPEPEVNVRIGPYLVDFLWRDRCLVVETDGYRYHRGRAAFEDDRARDLDLRGLGFEVIRLAEGQLRDDTERVAEVLVAALRVGADG